MSNSYFNKPTDIEPHTRALHTSINLLSQATDQAFDKIEKDKLPDQTGNDGKFLSTDGTTPSWKNLVQVQELIGDGSTTIDWNLGIKCHFTLGAQDEIFTFIAPLNPSPYNLLLKIKQDSVGGRNCIFPSTVKWLGEEPSWSAGQANKTIIISFYFDGVYYWGQATPWEVISYIAFVDKDLNQLDINSSDKFMQLVPVIGEDVTVDKRDNFWYSAGLAVLNYEDETIGIVKGEQFYNENDGIGWIEVTSYDQNSGQYLETLAICDEIGWVQAVNISPDGLELWFSWTDDNYNEYYWMKCTRSSTDEAFGQPVAQFSMPAAWKVLWDNFGEIWFAGRDTTDFDVNPVGNICLYRGLGLVKKISFESYSTGFAFDNFGNLWIGTYTDSEPLSQQYLLVFSVDKINGSGVLGINDADMTYEMPGLEIEGVSCFTGVSDIAYADSYMYISANSYSTWGSGNDIGCILRIPTHAGTLNDPFAMQEELENVYTVNPTIDWDWLKAIGVGLK